MEFLEIEVDWFQNPGMQVAGCALCVHLGDTTERWFTSIYIVCQAYNLEKGIQSARMVLQHYAVSKFAYMQEFADAEAAIALLRSISTAF